MKNIIQSQKITLVNLNDRNDVKIRKIYYLFGGLFTLYRDRKATQAEIENA